MPGSTLSVIIPAYRAGPYLERCLEAVARTLGAGDEIVVVADGESDGGWRIASRYGARVVELPARSGPARARNAGAEAARGELLLFIDADVVVAEGTLERVRRVLSAADAPDAVFGSYDDAPASPDLLSQYRNLLHHWVHQNAREDATTFFSACGALPRSTFLALGGFRPIAMEDIDLGYRLTQAGGRIRLDKGLQVKHLKRWRPINLITTDTIDRAMAWTLLLLEHRGRVRQDLNLKSEARASLILLFCFLCATAAAPFAPVAWVPAIGCLAGFLAENRALYGFLLAKRGGPFVLGAIPWHMVYYACGGVGFALGCAAHLARSGRRAGSA